MKKRLYSLFLIIILLCFFVVINGENVNAEDADFDVSGHGEIIESGSCGASDVDEAYYDIYEDGMCHISGCITWHAPVAAW